MIDFSLEALAPSASPNPLTLRQQLYQGSPGELSGLAAQFATAAGDTATAGAYNQRAKTLAEQGYVVDDKGVSPTEAASTKKILAGSNASMLAVARKLNDVSNALQASTIAANNAVSGVRGTLATIAARYNSEIAGLRNAAPQSAEAVQGQLQAIEQRYRTLALQKIGEAGRTVQTAVTSYEGSLGGAQKALSALGYAPPVGLNTGGNPANVAVPPKGTDPKKVAAWWKTADPAQRRYLLDHRYRELGNRGGVPAAVRHQANWKAVQEDVHSGDPRVQRNAKHIYDAVTRTANFYAAKGGDDVMLLAYEPDGLPQNSWEHGDTMAKFAIAIGDVDTADNVSVAVPGIDTTTASAGDMMFAGKQIHDSAALADPSKTNATVMWFGYDPPNKNEDGMRGIMDTHSDAKAYYGGAALAADIDGYQANRATPAHVTAIGHSYGSTVVSQAAKHHDLDVDDITLLGSIGPGQGIDHATDLNNAQHKYHVYTGTASSDNVEDWGGFHGGDPVSKDFGATRFRAEYDGPENAHKSYYQYNTESLSNVGLIVAGRGDDVSRAPYAEWKPGDGVYVDPEGDSDRGIEHPRTR